MKSHIHRIAIGVLLLAACEEDNGPDAGDEEGMAADTGDTGEAEESSSSTGEDFSELYACDDPELIEIQPLAGPGWDPEMGLLPPMQGSYVASSTMIMVKPEEMGRFFELVNAVVEQLQSTEGFVAMSLATDPTCGWGRTLTVWRDETAMYTFVVNGAHAEAMTQTFDIALTGKVTSWPIAAAEMPPTWDMAKAQLAAVEPIEAY